MAATEVDSVAVTDFMVADLTASMAAAMASTAVAMDSMVEVMATTADTMDTMAETAGIMATMAETMDTTGMVTTMDITVAGGRGSTAQAGVIRGTPMGAMDIPITALITIRAMGTRMGAITAATTAAPTTTMDMPPVQE